MSVLFCYFLLLVILILGVRLKATLKENKQLEKDLRLMVCDIQELSSSELNYISRISTLNEVLPHLMEAEDWCKIAHKRKLNKLLFQIEILLKNPIKNKLVYNKETKSIHQYAKNP